ncbi:carbohydrate ABC transporter permease [Phytoactinopolyspora alkaliphila]|uniref:Carbohydrate ABC transporter permease n=1 Tax=Phytoactinopolyspora alkaliphila TaxID=1783498 RepID=A0A6N9YNI1_9ACTN|nr:carbohydrate ABC transporter permease [Phytoactinopolyspora alkaliphila]NED96490.1 carbohydrate ABC transporter permease [Phytoactinopolyspora alkaliphila]
MTVPKGSFAGRMGRGTVIGLIVIVTAFPLYWLLISSLKPSTRLGEVSLIPSSVTLGNYVAAFDTQIPRWMLNTFGIALLTTLLGVVVAALAGFGFARYRFRGRSLLFGVVLASLAIPEYALVLPQFTIMRQFGLLNTWAAVILPLAANALVLFLLRQYFSQLPEELFDAARLDGSGEFRLFWTIAVPLVRPGLGAAGLLLFLNAWNAYLLPLVMLTNSEQFTMPIGLAFLHSQLNFGIVEKSPWGAITAGTVISIVPLILCLLVMQRQFIGSLTAGAVKA